MKKSILLFLVMVVFLSCASVPPSDMNYSDVVEVPGETMEDLFIKANIWFVETFASAESVIQFSDRERGIITGRYAYSFYHVGAPCIVFSVVNFEAREGRYRISIYQPQLFTGTNRLPNDPTKYGYPPIIQKNWEDLAKRLKDYMLGLDSSFTGNPTLNQDW
jgi:hypothetical protein